MHRLLTCMGLLATRVLFLRAYLARNVVLHGHLLHLLLLQRLLQLLLLLLRFMGGSLLLLLGCCTCDTTKLQLLLLKPKPRRTQALTNLQERLGVAHKHVHSLIPRLHRQSGSRNAATKASSLRDR